MFCRPAAALRFLSFVLALLAACLVVRPAGAMCVIAVDPDAGYLDAQGYPLLYGCPQRGPLEVPQQLRSADLRPENQERAVRHQRPAAVAGRSERDARIARALGQGYLGFRKVYRGQRYTGFRKVYRGQRYLGFQKVYAGPRYPSDLFGGDGRWRF